VHKLRVRAYAPVSLRRAVRGAAKGNLISQMVVHLPVDEPDPVHRLERIAVETAGRKGMTRFSMGTWFRLRIVRTVLLKVLARQRVNSVVTTVHGPRRTVYLAGAAVLEIFPVLNLFGNQTLGVGVVSYAGQFDIGITTDAAAYPDIDVLVSAMRDDLKALREVTQSAAIPSRAAA
jgi:hypothetical protein